MTDVAKTVAALELLGFKKVDYFGYACADIDRVNNLEPEDVVLSLEYFGKQILVGVNQWNSPESVLRTVLFRASKIEKQARNAKIVAVLDDLGIEIKPLRDW